VNAIRQGKPVTKANDGAAARDPVTLIRTPMRLDYTVSAGTQLSRYLHALAEKRIIGASCPTCNKVYVPPRGACPTCGIPTQGEIDIGHAGTVTTFCVIRIPFDNAAFDPPYVTAAILLDGADIPIFHLVRGIDVERVRMGMRVTAVWQDAGKLGPTLESIRWFEPNGEADAAYDSYAMHL
jgi:uncharacterized OB-fold protein